MHNEEVFCIILNRNKLGYWMAIRIIGCILYFFPSFLLFQHRHENSQNSHILNAIYYAFSFHCHTTPAARCACPLISIFPTTDRARWVEVWFKLCGRVGCRLLGGQSWSTLILFFSFSVSLLDPKLPHTPWKPTKQYSSLVNWTSPTGFLSLLIS